MPGTLMLPRPGPVSPFQLILDRWRRGPTESVRDRGGIPQTDDALWNYIHEIWEVAIPRLAVCPGHVAPFTAFADAYFARDSMLVWEASRGLGGKSFLLALLGLAIACTRGGDVNILGGSGQQSQRVHEYMTRAWAAPKAPREYLRSDPIQIKTRLADGSVIQALLASSTSVRGPHCPTLLLDECLPASTLIATPVGDVALGDMCAGDYVWSVDASGDLFPSVVSQIRFTGIKQTLRFIFERDIVLDVTANHPLLTTEGWMYAGEIAASRSEGLRGPHTQEPRSAPMVASTLGSLRVVAIERGPIVPVYNMTVEATHNFIANRIVVHNCDEFELKLFDAALGQTMAQPHRPAVTVMSSTHQYPDKTMTEIKKRAAIHGWSCSAWCYRETLQPHGWLEPAEVDRKRREVPAAMFRSEYDLQEPSTEGRAIDPEAVTACFQRGLGQCEGRPREYLEFEPPLHGLRYAHGADWAKEQDFTEIVTLRCDVLPYRVVAYERMQRLPWPQMVARFDTRVMRYNLGEGTWKACHDKTGLGNVVEGYLEHAVDGITMVGRGRADLFSEFIAAVERGEIISPFITSLESQVRFCTHADLYGAGHPPDGFVALALAYHAVGLFVAHGKIAGTWGR